MTQTLADLAIGTEWTELVAAQPALGGADAILQNVGYTPIALVFGGDDAPTGKSGYILGYLDSFPGIATKIWARGVSGTGKLSATVQS